jgi:hypothetical protein
VLSWFETNKAQNRTLKRACDALCRCATDPELRRRFPLSDRIACLQDISPERFDFDPESFIQSFSF